MARSRLHRRYARKNPAADPRPNPPLFSELAEFVAPGFAGFAATRFATRIAATQIAKRAPSWGKHAGAGVSVAAFLASWFLAHRLRWLAKYQMPITVGAAIAAMQSLVQLYAPRLGWMVADASPELDQAPVTQQLTAPPELQPVDDDPNEYTYNDSYDAGRYSHEQRRPQPGAGPARTTDEVDPSELAIDDAIGQSQNLGVFSTSN